MRLHHVNVVVPPGCTDHVVPFYELLGLTRVAKPTSGVAPEGAWFDLPGGTTPVHVSERDGQAHPQQHYGRAGDDLPTARRHASAAAALSTTVAGAVPSLPHRDAIDRLLNGA